MRHLATAAIAVAAVAAVTPVQAKDRNGYQAIAAQDFAKAERRLLAERRIHPNKPELLINLALVYRRTGRPVEARALYAAVLERDAVELDLPNGGIASSHELARMGLDALAAGSFAAR